MTKGRDAVFLDRDGTINEEVGYLSHVRELVLIPGAVEAIRLLNDAGMLAVVVSNQSGVARGYFDEKTVIGIHERINDLLKASGAHIDRFYYCPHHPTEGATPYRMACRCRKPEPGMILRARDDMQINLARSFLVGDMEKDMEAARNAGVAGILVRTGYGGMCGTGVNPAYVAPDVLAAVQWILERRTP